jgi:hypothetical protein
MTETAKIRQLVAEVGPLDDEVRTIAQTADDAWTVRYDHVDVDVEFEAGADRLVISTAIGPAPAERRLALYEALLTYSLLWRDTGGVRMGLDRPGGDVVQMVDLPATITAAQLATTMSNMVDRALIWRQMFAAEIPAETTLDRFADFGMQV